MHSLRDIPYLLQATSTGKIVLLFYLFIVPSEEDLAELSCAHFGSKDE